MIIIIIIITIIIIIIWQVMCNTLKNKFYRVLLHEIY